MDVYRPAESYHEESCNITLLSTRWTTSTPHCSVILWQCLFTFVDPRVPSPSSDPPAHLISHLPAKVHPQIHRLLEPSDAFFFHSHFCSSCAELFGGKITEIDKKSQRKSTTLGRFLWVNGCSKGKGRFSCSFHDLPAHKALRANLK